MSQPTFVAFLRAVNVGGTTMISMKALAELCTRIGFNNVRTYLNSGNVLFQSALREEEIQQSLESELKKVTGKHIDVILRTGDDLKRIVQENPFPDENPSQIGVLLVAKPVVKNILSEFIISGKERVVPKEREVFIHYPDGMGRSKLKIPAPLVNGTTRNIATITKLANLSSEK